MTFDLNPQSENSICEQCGKQGEVFTVTLSSEDKSVSKKLCRNCTVQAKRYVDRKNLLAQSSVNTDVEPAPRYIAEPEPDSVTVNTQSRKTAFNKRIIVLALSAALVLTGLAAGAAAVLHKRHLKPAESGTSSETYSLETLKELITETETETTEAETETAQEASSEDFDELEEMLEYILDGYVKFDVNDSDASEEVTDIIFRTAYPAYTLANYYKLSGEFDGDCAVYPGKSIDDIQTEVFGVKPDHKGESGVWYYKNNNYYEYIPATEGPPPRDAEITSKEALEDGAYLLKVRSRDNYENYFDYSGYGEYDYYTVKVRMNSTGSKYPWRILSIKYDKGNSYSSGNTKKKIYADDYTEAYRQFLLKTLYDKPESFQNPWFSFAYIDNDDIPELLISEGPYHVSNVLVYTYMNAEVKFVEELGIYGQFRYVERQGIVVHENSGHNTYTMSVMKIENGKSEVVWSCYEHDEYVAATEEVNSEYYVNDIPVSEEEFEAEVKKNTPKNLKDTKAADDSGAYELSYDKIMSFG